MVMIILAFENHILCISCIFIDIYFRLRFGLANSINTYHLCCVVRSLSRKGVSIEFTMPNWSQICIFISEIFKTSIKNQLLNT